jgi:hypothetical protein
MKPLKYGCGEAKPHSFETKIRNGAFEVLTTMLLRIQVFGDVTMCVSLGEWFVTFGSIMMPSSVIRVLVSL